MKRSTLVVAAVCLLLGLALGAVVSERLAVAQQAGNQQAVVTESRPSGVSFTRYQISAYGSTGGTGYFIVDTQTGKVWRGAMGKKLDYVSDGPTIGTKP